MPRSARPTLKVATHETAPMNPIDTFTVDWLGDTLFNVLLFNLVLVAPASFAMGHAMAIVWRPWHRVIFYSGLLSAGWRYLDYPLARGGGWARARLLLAWPGEMAMSGASYRTTRCGPGDGHPIPLPVDQRPRPTYRREDRPDRVCLGEARVG